MNNSISIVGIAYAAMTLPILACFCFSIWREYSTLGKKVIATRSIRTGIKRIFFCILGVYYLLFLMGI
jgi:hypothetical protein